LIAGLLLAPLLALLLATLLRTNREARRQAILLRQSEARFRAAIMYAPIGTGLMSPSGRWLAVNEAMATLLGYSAEELTQLTLQAVTHPDNLSLDTGLFRRLREDELPSYTVEKRLVHRDGSPIWVALSVSLVRDEQGAMDYLIVQMADQTERKAVDQMKNEFVSMVSHELRTPLTAIRGAIGLILGTQRASVPDKAVQLLEIAHQNSDRLILLINDILDIEKIASGKMQFQMRHTTLGPLLQQIVTANLTYAKQYQVSYALESVPAEWSVNVDPNRFAQIVTNLLSNATKYSPRNGTVRIAATREGDGKTVRIHVADRGPGIPENFRHRLFEKFSQADSSESRQRGGTGLGLFLCKQMIEHMRGSIGFETELGVGTTFHVDLPLTLVESAAATPGENSAPAGALCV